MRAYVVIAVLTCFSVAISAQGDAEKKLHTNSDGWGLSVVREEGQETILLIGNSICNGYKSYVGEDISGYRVIAWKNPYHLCSEHLYSDLEKVLADESIVLIHFNIGLHGWQEGRIPEGEYEAELTKYLNYIKAHSNGAKLIWASTTPITSESRPIELDKDRNTIIVERNAIAARVMEANGIMMNDLYSLCLSDLEAAAGDAFHWNQLMYQRLGAQVARTINSTLAPYDPHDEHIDYREDFRGQYHFSPRSEWMNDINGLVYQGGKYHMIYQWGKAIRHGGYATSPDLLHWKDEGVALIPQHSFLPEEAVRNVSGHQVYSGSAVVVSGQTAEKITGSKKEAMVAIYTGTGAGTCLAWSNDGGRSWHDYTHNPVAHHTGGEYPRDPCVIWHEASQKWILLLYESGTTFYSSNDLIHWDSLSNVDFGFECPDFFELPVDGHEENRKWVLQDANGSYLVGSFDGVRFTKDPKQDTLVMTLGPDFYAGQTFPMGNLPDGDPRVIQIAWMDHWNGGVGETVWERNATFPVSLGLVHDGGQQRISRLPVREISSLHESTVKWDPQVIEKGSNILSAVRSKKFHLLAEFNLSETEASKFEFQIANKTITYDVEKHLLMGETCHPDDDGLLRIQILVDWGQLEVFANNGIWSWSEQFAFSPYRDDLGLYADGKLGLKSMELHEMKRIW